MKPLLSIEGFAHRWTRERGSGQAGHGEVRLAESFGIPPGRCLALTGPSGCGKTTVLLAAAGLLDQGTTSGRIDRFASCGPAGTGVVFQNPETQILSSQILDEVMLGLLAAGEPVDAARDAALVELDRAGLGCVDASRPVEALSMGQKYRLCLAAMWALSPRLWLLDEPFSQLDASGRAMLRERLAEHLDAGGGVLLTAHRLPDLGDIPVQEIAVACGIGGIGPGDAGEFPPLPEWTTGEVLAELSGVEYGFSDDAPLLDGLDLRILPGDRVAVCGPNGTGKSTLASLLTGMVRPDNGTLRVAGRDEPRIRHLAGVVGLVPQDPDFVLTEPTVLEEAAFSARQWHGRAAVDDAAAWLRVLGIGHLSGEPPLALSFGQKRLLTVAAALAAAPRLLVLDEPFTGLDPGRVAAVTRGLALFQREHPGSAVLCLTHEVDPLDEMQARVLRFEGGRLV